MEGRAGRLVSLLELPLVVAHRRGFDGTRHDSERCRATIDNLPAAVQAVPVPTTPGPHIEPLLAPLDLVADGSSAHVGALRGVDLALGLA
jgi:hypothetical protein